MSPLHGRPHRRGPRFVTTGLGVVLLIPEVLLGADRTGGGTRQIVELLSVGGALVLGLTAAGMLLRACRGDRRPLAISTALLLLLCAAGFALANVWPPPYPGTYPAAGVPTLTGLLDAVDIALIIGAAAAALRLAVTQIVRLLRRAP